MLFNVTVHRNKPGMPKSALYLMLQKREAFKIVKKGNPLGFVKLQFVGKKGKTEEASIGDFKKSEKIKK